MKLIVSFLISLLNDIKVLIQMFLGSFYKNWLKTFKILLSKEIFDKVNYLN